MYVRLYKFMVYVVGPGVSCVLINNYAWATYVGRQHRISLLKYVPSAYTYRRYVEKKSLIEAEAIECARAFSARPVQLSWLFSWVESDHSFTKSANLAETINSTRWNGLSRFQYSDSALPVVVYVRRCICCPKGWLSNRTKRNESSGDLLIAI